MYRYITLLLLLSLADCRSPPHYTPAEENEIRGHYLASKVPVHEFAASLEVMAVQCEYRERKQSETERTGDFLEASQWYVSQLEGVSIEELANRCHERASAPTVGQPAKGSSTSAEDPSSPEP